MKSLVVRMILLAIIAATTVSCTKDDDEMYNLPEKFPLKTGNNWEYERTINMYTKDDSTAVSATQSYTDTTIYKYLKHQVVVKDTVLEDTIPVYILSSEEFDVNKKQDTHFHISYLWNKENGLFSYESYYEEEKHDINEKKYKFKGIEFNTLDEFKAILGMKTNNVPTTKSTYQSYKEIEYPIETGNEWLPLPKWPISKRKVMSEENFDVPAGTFEVYKIRTYWDWDDDGIWDDDMIYDEYFSKYGIVATRMQIWNAQKVGEYGELYDYFDWVEEEVLTDYNIK